MSAPHCHDCRTDPRPIAGHGYAAVCVCLAESRRWHFRTTRGWSRADERPAPVVEAGKATATPEEARALAERLRVAGRDIRECGADLTKFRDYVREKGKR